MINCDDLFDFEIPEELLNGSTSSEESSVDKSQVEEHRIVPKIRRKFVGYSHNGNKKSKLFEVDGQLVSFEASFPLPRVVYSDIRGCYASMFTNAMNSHDFPLLYGFLDTFCVPNACYASTKATSYRDARTSTEQGLFAMGRKFYARMQCAPDTVSRLGETSIISYSGTKAVKIVAKFNADYTEILDRPRARRHNESSCPLVASEHQFVCPYASGKRKQPEKGMMLDIMQRVDLRGLPVKAKPVALKAVGEVVIYVDEQKRITRIEKNFTVTEPN